MVSECLGYGISTGPVENVFMNSEDSEQPAQLHSMITAVVAAWYSVSGRLCSWSACVGSPGIDPEGIRVV